MQPFPFNAWRILVRALEVVTMFSQSCLGRLRIRCHYLHLVTAMQHLLQLYILAVHFCTDTFAAQFAMDVERKIEHGGAFWQV